MFVYDWDTVLLADNTTAFASIPLSLCTKYLPCALQVRGDGAVELSGDAQFVCLSSAGCSSISIYAVDFTCRNNSKSVFQMQGSVLTMFKASFVGCRSGTDGGVVQAYNLAEVVIQACNFTNVHSDGFGAAVAAYGSSLSVIDSRLHNCSSRSGGGAVWVSAFPDCFRMSQGKNTYLHIIRSVFVRCSTGTARCAACCVQDFALILWSRRGWRCCLGQLALALVGGQQA
jgi:hypothetical protein